MCNMYVHAQVHRYFYTDVTRGNIGNKLELKNNGHLKRTRSQYDEFFVSIEQSTDIVVVVVVVVVAK